MELGRKLPEKVWGSDYLSRYEPAFHCCGVHSYFLLISCEFNLISYYSRKKHGLTLFFFLTKGEPLLRNGLNRAYCSVSARLKCQFLMFISILVFRPEGQIWNPVRRDTRIYVQRILNASRISKTQLNSCTISPS